MKENTKKVFIKNFGCQMNVRDSEVVCGLLRANSFELTAKPEDAGIIIFNTCSVRQHAEDKVWSEIGRIAKGSKKSCRLQASSSKTRECANALTRKPIIGVIGCMAQNYKEQVFERCPEVDFVVGPSDIAKIPSILAKVTSHQPPATSRPLYEMKIWETDGELRPEEIYHTGYYEDKEHAHVVISEGCSNGCSYCVVPYVRGPLHNRNYKEIIREIELAIDKGITKITLLGQNVNAYRAPEHQSTGTQVDFIELLKLVNNVKGLKEFSFITSHPKDTSIELFKAMAECNKLKKYLHLPVQSGSDKILERMNRGYTKKFYLDLVDNYRKIVKEGVLSTDIIVGFPEEDEVDFQDTYNLMKEIQFNSAYIFKYSPRPHTEALKWQDDVLKEEKERRHKLILDLQKKISMSKKKRC
jgi:tRNA-2-methylthio-N6-dimethylallyladenosine synthase